MPSAAQNILLDPTAHPVIAHRGASGEFPENTVLAFQQALAQGADALELDVRATADGVPVVLHDETVDRTSGGTGPVSQFTLNQLRHLPMPSGQPIPTLEEILERFRETPLLIDIKGPGAGGTVAALVKRHGAAGRAVIGSFHRAALRPARAEGLATAAARREVGPFWAASRLGVPRWGGRYHVLSVPERQGWIRVVDAALLRLARHMGKAVHVWTVNDPAAALRLWALGAGGMLTDYPRRLLDGARALRTATGSSA